MRCGDACEAVTFSWNAEDLCSACNDQRGDEEEDEDDEDDEDDEVPGGEVTEEDVPLGEKEDEKEEEDEDEVDEDEDDDDDDVFGPPVKRGRGRNAPAVNHQAARRAMSHLMNSEGSFDYFCEVCKIWRQVAENAEGKDLVCQDMGYTCFNWSTTPTTVEATAVIPSAVTSPAAALDTDLLTTATASSAPVAIRSKYYYACYGYCNNQVSQPGETCEDCKAGATQVAACDNSLSCLPTGADMFAPWEDAPPQVITKTGSVHTRGFCPDCGAFCTRIGGERDCADKDKYGDSRHSSLAVYSATDVRPAGSHGTHLPQSYVPGSTFTLGAMRYLPVGKMKPSKYQFFKGSYTDIDQKTHAFAPSDAASFSSVRFHA